MTVEPVVDFDGFDWLLAAFHVITPREMQMIEVMIFRMSDLF